MKGKLTKSETIAIRAALKLLYKLRKYPSVNPAHLRGFKEGVRAVREMLPDARWQERNRNRKLRARKFLDEDIDPAPNRCPRCGSASTDCGCD